MADSSERQQAFNARMVDALTEFNAEIAANQAAFGTFTGTAAL